MKRGQKKVPEDKYTERYTHFLTAQYNARMQFLQGTTRLYYQSVWVVGLAIFALGSLIITQLGKNSIVPSPLLSLAVALIPLLIASWFATYLFLFWSNSVTKVSVDYIEKKFAEEIVKREEPDPLFHYDFHGVLNDAVPINLPVVRNILYIHFLFIIIALPLVILYGVGIYFAWKLWPQSWFWQLWKFPYIIGCIIILVILIGLNLSVVKRGRELSSALKMTSQIELKKAD